MGRGEPTHRQMRAWERRRTRGLEGRDIVGICGILGPDLAEMQIRERGPFAGGPQPYEGLLLEPYSGWMMCIRAV